MLRTHSGNFNKVDITNALLLDIRHKIVKSIESYSRREFLSCIIDSCRAIKEQINTIVLHQTDKNIFVFFKTNTWIYLNLRVINNFFRVFFKHLFIVYRIVNT